MDSTTSLMPWAAQQSDGSTLKPYRNKGGSQQLRFLSYIYIYYIDIHIIPWPTCNGRVGAGRNGFLYKGSVSASLQIDISLQLHCCSLSVRFHISPPETISRQPCGKFCKSPKSTFADIKWYFPQVKHCHNLGTYPGFRHRPALSLQVLPLIHGTRSKSLSSWGNFSTAESCYGDLTWGPMDPPILDHFSV